MKAPGYTMAEVAAGFARLASDLRKSGSAFGELARRAADVDCYYEQARIAGLTRDQAEKILKEERTQPGRTFNEIMTHACRRLMEGPMDSEFERAVQAVVRASGAPASVVRHALITVGLYRKYEEGKDK